MSGRSLTRTTFFTGVSKGAEGLGSLAATIIVARYLGPGGYGIYAQVVSAVMLLWPLVDMGLDHVVVRELVTGARKEVVLGSGLLLRLLAGLACSLLLMSWVLFIGPGPLLVTATALAVLNILVVRQASNLVCRALFLGVERVEHDALVTGVGQAARLGGLLVAAHLDLGLIGVLAIPTVIEVFQVVLSLGLAHRFVGLRALRVELPFVRRLLRQSWSLLLRLLLVTAYFHVDNVLLATILPPEDLGLFAAPFRLVTGLVMVVVPTAWALLPSLVRNTGVQGSAQVMGRVGPLATAAAALMGVGFVLGARPLVSLTFGAVPRLDTAATCLRLLALLPALHTVTYIMELELLAAGRQQWALVGAAPALAVKVAADLLLAGALGPLTGAVSSLIADGIRLALMIRVTRSPWIGRAMIPIAALGLLVAGSLIGGIP